MTNTQDISTSQICTNGAAPLANIWNSADNNEQDFGLTWPEVFPSHNWEYHEIGNSLQLIS